MDLPYQETFSPSRLHWSWRIGTTASADFWTHEPSYLGSPRLSGKPYSRVRVQISPNKNVNFRYTTAAFTLAPESGALPCGAGSPEDWALYAVSVRRLIALHSGFLQTLPHGNALAVG